MFDIELTQMDLQQPVQEPIQEVVNTEKNTLNPSDEDAIEEYCPSVEDLEETELDLEEESIYDIYDAINQQIKQDMVENIRKLFIQKNLKLKLNLAEVVDDEEPDSE